MAARDLHEVHAKAAKRRQSGAARAAEMWLLEELPGLDSNALGKSMEGGELDVDFLALLDSADDGPADPDHQREVALVQAGALAGAANVIGKFL